MAGSSNSFDPAPFLNALHAKTVCCGCDDDEKERLTIVPGLLYYSFIAIGEKSEAQPLVITNTGELPVGVQYLEMSDEFEIVNSNVMPTTILPGNSITVQIRFRPKEAGVRSSVLKLKAGVKPKQDCVVAVGVGGKHEFVPDILQMTKNISNQMEIVRNLEQIFNTDLRWTYDVSLAAYDLFGMDMVIGPVPVSRTCYFPSAGFESQAGGLPPLADDHIFTLYKNSIEVMGTLTVTETTGVLVWDIPADTTFDPGDTISMKTTQVGFDPGSNYGVTLRFRRIDV